MMHFRISFMGSDSSINPHCEYVFLSERLERAEKVCEETLGEYNL